MKNETLSIDLPIKKITNNDFYKTRQYEAHMFGNKYCSKCFDATILYSVIQVENKNKTQLK